MEGFRRRSRRGIVHREVCGYTYERMEERERLALKTKVKEEKHLLDIRGLREDIGMKMYSRGRMELCEKAETAISCRGPGPARTKKEIYQWSGGEGRGCTHVPVWQNIRVGLT